jgi:hypothetical protein
VVVCISQLLQMPPELENLMITSCLGLHPWTSKI